MIDSLKASLSFYDTFKIENRRSTHHIYHSTEKRAIDLQKSFSFDATMSQRVHENRKELREKMSTKAKSLAASKLAATCETKSQIICTREKQTDDACSRNQNCTGLLWIAA